MSVYKASKFIESGITFSARIKDEAIAVGSIHYTPELYWICEHSVNMIKFILVRLSVCFVYLFVCFSTMFLVN